MHLIFFFTIGSSDYNEHNKFTIDSSMTIDKDKTKILPLLQKMYKHFENIKFQIHNNHIIFFRLFHCISYYLFNK